MEERTRAYHHASREEKSHANNARFVRYYEEICRARSATAWPAHEYNVGCFLTKYCDSLESVQSLDNALSAIRVAARERCGQVFTKPQEWYLKRITRSLKKVYRQPTRRKRPMTMDVMEKLVLCADLESVKGLQNLTQAFVQHDACLRTKEALALRVSDLSWEADAEGRAQSVAFLIRVSKARYESEAETVEVPPYTLDGKYWCAVRFLSVYMADPRVLARHGEDTEAFLFPSLSSGKTGFKPQSYNSFVGWVRQTLEKAGLASREFAGHSFRAGGATDLHTGKVPEVLGRMIGRWRCREAYFLYLRENPKQQLGQLRAAFEAAWVVHAEDRV